jgi:hypothetical protein
MASPFISGTLRGAREFQLVRSEPSVDNSGHSFVPVSRAKLGNTLLYPK